MSLTRLNCRGVSIIEVILASVLMMAVMITLSLAFPQATRSINQTRVQTMAADIAQDQLELSKNNYYDILDTSDRFNAGAFVAGSNCDCTSVNYSVLPSSTSMTSGSITYTAVTCVNFVIPGSWQPQCLPNDTGYKNISVQVSWPCTAGQTCSLVKQSILSRT